MDFVRKISLPRSCSSKTARHISVPAKTKHETKLVKRVCDVRRKYIKEADENYSVSSNTEKKDEFDTDNYEIESVESFGAISDVNLCKDNSASYGSVKNNTIIESDTNSLVVNWSSGNNEFDAFKNYLEGTANREVETPTIYELDGKNNQKLHSIKKNDSFQNDSLSQSSQFFNSTQVLRQIEKAISFRDDDVENQQCIIEEENNEPSNSNKRKFSDVDKDCFKIPKLALNNKDTSQVPEIDRTITDLFSNNNIDIIFDEIENSIYHMGNSPKKGQKTVSDEVMKVILDPNPETEKIYSSLSSFNWREDTVFNQPDLDYSFGSAFKSALLANVSRNVVQPQNNVSINFDYSRPSFNELGPFYGLPDRIKDLLKQYKGIDGLYDWQQECLSLPAIQEKSNLIYALPTSGGKTLVAEILIFRELLCYKRNALFILPFVAIVQEKVWSLSPFAVTLDFLVEEYAGSKGTYPPRKRRRKNSVYIATIEKALGLLNSLIEAERLNELGLIVVDELHLVGETGRGPTLEALLTKLMYLGAARGVQIIGMSATIGNLQDICEFLDSQVYTKDFRPVELTEYVKCGDQIAKVNWNQTDETELLDFDRTLDFKYSKSIKDWDPDQLGGLVMEVIPKGSCLIFCSSKKNCENVAKLLSRILFKNLKDHKSVEKKQIIQSLTGESGSLCSVLKYSIPFGIAYHHSGLTVEERRIIEDGFRAGVICVICCTSTLAAGVNLPAKRVILRQPYIGKDFINLSRYKQMIGRAGRAGLGEAGDSILVCANQDLPKVKELLQSPMDKALSSIHENSGKGLRHLLLSCIALGIANTRTELQAVTRKTLWAVQNPKADKTLKNFTDKMIKELFVLGALQTTSHAVNSEDVALPNVSLRLETTVTSDEQIDSQNSSTHSKTKQRVLVSKTSKLVISKFGMAAIKGGLELSRAHMLYEDMLQAQCSLVLVDALHLLYLVTPYDLSEQIKPNMNCYYNILSNLNPNEMKTARILGFNESVVVKMLSNQPIKTIPERVLNRFYLTLLLYDLWNEMPLFEAADKFQLNRGLVQNLMQSSASFASNVVNFCQELEEFWPFAHLLKGMSSRISHCCLRELLPLMELPAVKQSRAKQLYNAGFKTLQSIARANVDDLVRDIEYMPKKTANQLIAASKMLLLEKVENLREEAEDVLNGVENLKQLNLTLIR